MNWTEAAQSCVAQSGQLVSLRDADTQTALRTQLSDYDYGDTWAGGRSRRVDWHWTAGRGLSRGAVVTLQYVVSPRTGVSAQVTGQISG